MKYYIPIIGNYYIFLEIDPFTKRYFWLNVYQSIWDLVGIFIYFTLFKI